MAETAKILSKDKKILTPRMDAGCPMADMVEYEDLLEYKKNNPERYIVSYVNTTAKVKTLTDICVTSSTAMSIMNQIEANQILFLPDKNLGGYIKKQVPDKDIELWPGFCLTHHRLQKETVLMMKKRHPKAVVLAHPECNEEVLTTADYIGSTKGIIDYVNNSKDVQFIIATEDGIMHPLQTAHPDKEFILASNRLVCQNMKKITLEDLYNCLVNETEEMILDEQVIEEAIKPLEKMLQLS
jgi:quinolinate synthase